MKMKRGTLIALAAVFFLGSAGYASAQVIPPPPPGQDMFESLAEIGVVFVTPPGVSIDIDVVGPTTIDRGPADAGGVIQTRILGLSLAGGGTAMDSFFDVFVELQPDRPSTGQIDTISGNSFFDVFVQIRVRQGDQELGVFHNTDPVRLQAKINAIPPIETAYVPPTPVSVPLVDAAGNPVGLLIHVQHVPAQPSHAKMKRELILIEKKLDRLIRFLGAP